jgi:transposase-like protein
MMGYGVWRSVRFCLSERDVEALTAQRGVILTDDVVR